MLKLLVVGGSGGNVREIEISSDEKRGKVTPNTPLVNDHVVLRSPGEFRYCAWFPGSFTAPMLWSLPSVYVVIAII